MDEYDQTKKLVIDPVVLVYSSFLGGSGFDIANAIAVDNQGNSYIAGYTESINFPTTVGSKQITYGGGEFDAFVSKFNAAGNQLIYSSYLVGLGGIYISDHWHWVLIRQATLTSGETQIQKIFRQRLDLFNLNLQILITTVI